MAQEAHGNGYRGGAATGRRMRSRSVGFSHHDPASLKPVHMRIGNRAGHNPSGWAGLHHK